MPKAPQPGARLCGASTGGHVCGLKGRSSKKDLAVSAEGAMGAAHSTGQESLEEPPPGDCEGIAFGKTKHGCASKTRTLCHAHFGGRRWTKPFGDRPGLQRQLQLLWGTPKLQDAHARVERRLWRPPRPQSGQLPSSTVTGGCCCCSRCRLGGCRLDMVRSVHFRLSSSETINFITLCTQGLGLISDRQGEGGSDPLNA